MNKFNNGGKRSVHYKTVMKENEDRNKWKAH